MKFDLKTIAILVAIVVASNLLIEYARPYLTGTTEPATV